MSNQSSSLIILITILYTHTHLCQGKKTVVLLPREPVNDFNLLVGILGFDRDLKNLRFNALKLEHAQAQRQYTVSGSGVLLADESHVPEKHISHAHDDAHGYFNLHTGIS